MGKIKVLKEENIYGGNSSEAVYPVTSTRAVYNQHNIVLDDLLEDIENNITHNFNVTINNSINTAKQEIQNYVQDQIAGIETGGVDVDTLKGLIEESEAVSNLDSKIDTIGGKVDTLNTTTSDLNTTITGFGTDLTELTEKVSTNKNNISSNTINITTNKNNITTNTTEITKVKTRIEEVASQIKSADIPEGIVPESLSSTQGCYASSGISYENSTEPVWLTDKYIININTNNQLVTELHFYADKAGSITFGIGKIDENNKVGIRQTFKVTCNQGENRVSVLQYNIILVGENIFVFNSTTDSKIGYIVKSTTVSGVKVIAGKAPASTMVYDESWNTNSRRLNLEYKVSYYDNYYSIGKYQLLYGTKQEINYLKYNQINLFKVITNNERLLTLYKHLNKSSIVKYDLSESDTTGGNSSYTFNKVIFIGNESLDGSTGLQWIPSAPTNMDLNYKPLNLESFNDLGAPRGIYSSTPTSSYSFIVADGIRSMFGNSSEYFSRKYIKTNIEVDNSDITTVINEARTFINNDIKSLIIIRLGENVSDVASYSTRLKELVRGLRNAASYNTLILLTGSYNYNEELEDTCINIALQNNCLYVPVTFFSWEYYARNNSDVIDITYTSTVTGSTIQEYRPPLKTLDRVLGDVGHMEIANRILNVLGIADSDAYCVSKVHVKSIKGSAPNPEYNSYKVNPFGICTINHNIGNTNYTVKTVNADGSNPTTLSLVSKENYHFTFKINSYNDIYIIVN